MVKNKNSSKNTKRNWTFISLFTVLIVAILFVAGCRQVDTGANETTTGAGVGVTPTPDTTGEQQTTTVTEPTVTLTQAPTSARVGESFTVTWRVDGDGTASQTSVYFGPDQVTDPAGPEDYPMAGRMQCQDTTCNLPNTFSDRIAVPTAGTYYYRAHAIVDGEDVWSDEVTLRVTGEGATGGAASASPSPSPMTGTSDSDRTGSSADNDGDADDYESGRTGEGTGSSSTSQRNY